MSFCLRHGAAGEFFGVRPKKVDARICVTSRERGGFYCVGSVAGEEFFGVDPKKGPFLRPKKAKKVGGTSRGSGVRGPASHESVADSS